MKQIIQPCKAVKHWLLLLVCSIVLPAIGYSQPPGPEDGEVGPDVPFDSNMNLVFLVIGVLFATVIVWQELKRRHKLRGTAAE
ncbi:MAG TPA: hypothetical protein PKC39_08300 [Ferruginibacter sp.]|nr:hypothetical protein [Ferruginibacter sp.]HMP20943.1 hypothetical protein [Ferruginibacter sp.]